MESMNGNPQRVFDTDPRQAKSWFSSGRPRMNVVGRPSSESRRSWPIDLIAVAYCRELFARNGLSELRPGNDGHYLSFIEVPAAYDDFCRAHFTAVKRLQPDFVWDEVCQIYAIALFAHAMLCVELTGERERQLEQHWSRIRGQSKLSWAQARPLVADGCRALARLDPIASPR